MKIIRHLSPTGPAWAALQPDGSARAITGDLLGDFQVTDQEVSPGKLLAPLQPANLLCIGLNYKQHAAESNSPAPVHPVLFIKNTASVQNPGDPIELPVKLASTKVDYECELAIVIGRKCKNVSKAEALDYVLGYTCANDVSARDWQRDGGGGQWCQGKSFDTFCPLGPVLVTRDEIPNPNALRIRTVLNGAVMQDWNTDDMIFDVPSIIAFLSASKTLLPGTVILTGTPHGVGFARTPPVWLKAGDTVSIEIEKIGTLTNPVVNEKP
jgi:2-keto-4-pentenoate hydratase/2-oxohepta-3-ene-1,7-dioic acid hydratase in catechol pathway